jgi:hypothetical protein
MCWVGLRFPQGLRPAGRSMDADLFASAVRRRAFGCCVEKCMKQASARYTMRRSSHKAVAVCRLAGAGPVQSWLRSRAGDGRSDIAPPRGATVIVL